MTDDDLVKYQARQRANTEVTPSEQSLINYLEAQSLIKYLENLIEALEKSAQDRVRYERERRKYAERDAQNWKEAYEGQKQNTLALQRELDEARAQVAKLQAQLEEREHDMHLRVRGEYDRTIADAWRAEVDKLKQELAEAREELADAEERITLLEGTVLDGK